MSKPSVSRTPYQFGDAFKANVEVVRATAADAEALLHSSGELKFGQGLIATIIALALGVLCLLGVLAFHYPEYLTTPELRQKYSVDVLRHAMFAALIVAGGLSLANLVLGVRRNLNLLAFTLVIAAVAFGGSRVPVGDFPDHTPYIGLDWFILDLLGSTLDIRRDRENVPAVQNQSVFRREWQTDLKHFAVNHFLVGLILLSVNFTIHHGFSWLVSHDFQLAVQKVWFFPQLLYASSSPILRSTGRTARTTRFRSCGASTPCITARRRWTGSPARASTCSRSCSRACACSRRCS
jgi:hypothetical protein